MFLYSFVGSTLGKPLTHNAGRLFHLITPYLRYPLELLGGGDSHKRLPYLELVIEPLFELPVFRMYIYI
jgi:hypothetical protein